MSLILIVENSDNQRAKLRKIVESQDHIVVKNFPFYLFLTYYIAIWFSHLYHSI